MYTVASEARRDLYTCVVSPEVWYYSTGENLPQKLCFLPNMFHLSSSQASWSCSKVADGAMLCRRDRRLVRAGAEGHLFTYFVAESWEVISLNIKLGLDETVYYKHIRIFLAQVQKDSDQ